MVHNKAKDKLAIVTQPAQAQDDTSYQEETRHQTTQMMLVGINQTYVRPVKNLENLDIQAKVEGVTGEQLDSGIDSQSASKKKPTHTGEHPPVQLAAASDVHHQRPEVSSNILDEKADTVLSSPTPLNPDHGPSQETSQSQPSSTSAKVPRQKLQISPNFPELNQANIYKPFVSLAGPESLDSIDTASESESFNIEVYDILCDPLTLNIIPPPVLDKLPAIFPQRFLWLAGPAGDGMTYDKEKTVFEWNMEKYATERALVLEVVPEQAT